MLKTILKTEKILMQVFEKHCLHNVSTHSDVWTDVDVLVFLKPLIFLHQSVLSSGLLK